MGGFGEKETRGRSGPAAGFSLAVQNAPYRAEKG